MTAMLIAGAFTMTAQTLDTEALKDFAPTTVRATFDVARYVHLTPQQQVAVAKAIEKQDAEFVRMVTEAGGILPVADDRKLQRQHDKALASILSKEELEQYYRGVYDAEANAEGIAIADKLRKKYKLTDENWKFVRIAFYKIGLEGRVIKKLMADKPKAAAAAVARLRDEQLKTIEEKGGFRVDPDKMTVEFIRPFDPTALHKE